MLDSLKKRPGSLRWPPRQRFSIADLGRAALTAYRESIASLHAQAQKGRDELERIERGWADTYQVMPADAAVLGEFSEQERLPREVQGSLDNCGTTLQEVQAAVDRLYIAGLLIPAGGAGPLPAKNSQ